MSPPARDDDSERRLVDRLRGARPRFHVHAYLSLTSTQDQARELVRGGAPHGTVVIARAQTRGRGRLGSSWISAPELGLYLSVALRPKRPPVELPPLSLVAAVAAAEALSQACGVKVELKWPNDLLLRRRKLGGILGELELNPDGPAAVVLGIGINLNQQARDFAPELRRRAISVRRATGRTCDRIELAASLLQALGSRYREWEARGLPPALRRFRRLSPMLRGARVRVDTGKEMFSGVTHGLDRDGRLIVALGDRRLVHLHAAEVHLLPAIS